MQNDYIEDPKRRSACKLQRIQTLAKKAHELKCMCGGTPLIYYLDENQNGYFYGPDEAWEGFISTVSQSAPNIPVPPSKTASKLNDSGCTTEKNFIKKKF